jgi:hypothetical protein
MVNKALKDFQAEVTREAGYIMKKGALYVTGEANISVRSTSKKWFSFTSQLGVCGKTFHF